jgi:hypothetical protein
MGRRRWTVSVGLFCSLIGLFMGLFCRWGLILVTSIMAQIGYGQHEAANILNSSLCSVVQQYIY